MISTNLFSRLATTSRRNLLVNMLVCATSLTVCSPSAIGKERDNSMLPKNGLVKIYDLLPNGSCTTRANIINAKIFAFLFT